MSDLHDVARHVFINDESELRSGWRVLVFGICLIIVLALLTGFALALGTLAPSLDYLRRDGLIPLAASNVSNLAAALIASAICVNVLERRRLGSVGFKLHRRWLRDFVLGSMLGAASLAIAVGIAASTGAYSFDVQTPGFASLARGFAITSLIFVVAGATEELIFRGFPFQALVHNLGESKAVVISSLVFGLAHLTNPGASVFSTTNTVLAGIWLGLAYLMTRSLWLATALHWSWNFAMVFIFGLPVSGLTTLGDLSWLKGRIGEPIWISGGNYGPEAGLAATVALTLSTLAIWQSGLFTTSNEMLLAITHGKPEPALLSITPDTEALPAIDQDNQNSESRLP